MTKMSVKPAIPEVDFTIGYMGVTIYCDRLETPRFLPFDIKGKCETCQSSLADIDFLITKEGITIWCSRVKGEKFLPFDMVFDLPDKCFFRVKSKGRVYSIPYVSKKVDEIKDKITTTIFPESILGNIKTDENIVNSMEVSQVN